MFKLDSIVLDDALLDRRVSPCMNDCGGVVEVFEDRLEIKFSDEETARIFTINPAQLYQKLTTYKEVCFDNCLNKRLKFDLETLRNSVPSIRIKILNSQFDNDLVEVSRSLFLENLWYYFS